MKTLTFNEINQTSGGDNATFKEIKNRMRASDAAYFKLMDNPTKQAIISYMNDGLNLAKDTRDYYQNGRLTDAEMTLLLFEY